MNKEILSIVCFVLVILFFPCQSVCNSSIKTTQHTIIIDPGHGGNDAGLRTTSGLQEKDLTLQIALLVKKILALNYTVLCTRKTDISLMAVDRTFFANNHRADLFISLHLNSTNKDNGFFFFFSSPRNGRTREKDTSLLWRWQPLQHSKESKLAATIFLETFSTHKTQKKFQIGVAPLLILEGLNMPSLVIEPLSIRVVPESIIEQNKILEQYAQLIAQSIDEFFKRKKLASKPE